MSRYATTSYNRFLRVRSELADIYSRARAYRLTADTVSDKLKALYQSSDYRKLTAYSRGMIHGLQEGHSQDIWANRVIWMLGPESGPSRTVHTEWTEEMSTLCRQPGKLYGGHFWLDREGQPLTDKPYTEYKPTN